MTPSSLPRLLLPLLALAGCVAAEGERAATATPAAVGLRAPHDSLIPKDALGASIRRGRAILAATRDSLPRHVGGNLRCTSCHLDDGRRPDAAPLIGVYGQFPQFRSRTGTVGMIEERINDCFQRSMNGVALDWQGRDMRDIVAYLSFLAWETATPARVPGQGIPKLEPPESPPDSARGAAVYAQSCASCHGPDGAGGGPAPALWGAASFNVAASMARVGVAAGFIKHNMPLDRPGTLTTQQAYDVARYMNGHRRPDFAGKENDWPNGDAPADVPYRKAMNHES